MHPVIDTSGLSRSFGIVKAVDQVDLTVNEGEMFGIVGPDGAGKTTLIRLLCGILLPSSGTATVLGRNLLKEADEVKREIGYLSQRFTLYGDLTIDENIEFFAEINNVRDYRERREQLLEFTRLTPFRGRLAEQLSGGMKQKLALACTLVHTPRIIFLDEPTTGVDPVSRRDFWKILQSLIHQGITIVMTTPYLDEAERCTRVALLNRGSIMRVAPPAELKALMKGTVVEISCDRIREGFRLLKEARPDIEVQAFGDRLNVILQDAARDLKEITRILTAAGIQVAATRVVPPTLENVFISMLTHPEGVA
jgi:ABC-2 type transport system ATP-binding protein